MRRWNFQTLFDIPSLDPWTVAAAFERLCICYQLYGHIIEGYEINANASPACVVQWLDHLGTMCSGA